MLQHSLQLLQTPVVAALLGVVLGFALLLANRLAVTFVTAEEPELGVARAVAIAMLAMMVAFGALMLFYFFLRPGLTAFGIGLIVGFLVPAFVVLFTFAGPAKSSN